MSPRSMVCGKTKKQMSFYRPGDMDSLGFWGSMTSCSDSRSVEYLVGMRPSVSICPFRKRPTQCANDD
ncbi:hypothetical protein F511_47585 [Dorcoceras hygrometricum]|uniref:Uncharacterized protein n=1 Tax=Dorcoceras hygrometricum TaxID=472368 RepID=A0A2Z6ZXV4_9LAMI|nr:hypothetical protein F511_47585 [Dorcoceras hygrometricum]